MRTIVEVNNVIKMFENTKALQGVSFKVKANDFVAVLGKSGSGKSTLFHIINGLVKPDEGNVIISGKEINSMKKKNFIEFRRKNIGYVFQDFKLISELSVEDNILFPIDLRNEKIDYFYYDLLLQELHIDHLKDRLVKSLSGGEKQRVGIARALINKPELVLADEPTGNLDSYNTEEVLSLFVHLQKMFSLTLMIATHDYAVAKKASRLIVLQDGRVIKNVQK
ncbi:ABC transporter ATP-binding protein [Merdibacter massiliensis]|uniref:ABC transporter ATP-binding protein n=1 Tax=Merdibacter massiliensis TaxID=1871030 RepID=UPI00096A394E|nr:ABC transporter ATP-binding protein [Merdibacter massiliensis]